MDWLTKTLLATALLVPAWLSIGFFEKAFRLRAEVVTMWYMFGIALGSMFALPMFKIVTPREMAPNTSVLWVLLVGLVIGTSSNQLLFSSLSQAPNPGIPIAISNGAGALVFLVAGGLAAWLPQHFSAVSMDRYHLLGILLTVGGTALIVVRR